MKRNYRITVQTLLLAGVVSLVLELAYLFVEIGLRTLWFIAVQIWNDGLSPVILWTMLFTAVIFIAMAFGPTD